MLKIFEFIIKEENSPLNEKKGELFAEGLELDSDLNDPIEYSCEEFSMKLDGRRYVPDVVTFTGRKIFVADVFEDVLNSFLRDSKQYSFTYVDERFKKIKRLQKVASEGLYESIMQVDFYLGFIQFRLAYATESYRWYLHDELILMLDADGKVVTNIEAFAVGAWSEAVRKVANGTERLLYCSLSDEESEFLLEN